MRPLHQKAAALLAGLTVSLGLGEAIARLTLPAPEYLYLRPYDPEVGFLSTPNQVRTSNDDEGPFPWRLNSLGFRGPELPESPVSPDDPPRVLFLGDSFLMGWGVREESLIPAVVQTALRAEGVTKGCYSISCDGYGTTQELLLLRRYLQRTSPEHVVLCFYMGNDIANNSIELAGHSRQTQGGYLRPFHVADAGGGWHIQWRDPWRQALRKHSRLFQVVEHRLVEGDWIDTGETAEGALLPEKERLQAGLLPRDYLELYTTDAGPRYEQAWGATEAALRDLRDEVRSFGSKLLVAVIPHKFEVQRDATFHSLERRVERTGAAPIASRVDWNLPSDRLAEALDRLGIKSLFLAKSLRRETLASRGSRYLRDGHLNGRGHELAGRAIASALLAPERVTPSAATQAADAPIDLLDLAMYERGQVDFSTASQPELMGLGWRDWREWRDEHPGWSMSYYGEFAAPAIGGELHLRCWIPESVELPRTIRINDTKHVVNKGGRFELTQKIAAAPGKRWRMITLRTPEKFPLDQKSVGLILMGYEVVQ